MNSTMQIKSIEYESLFKEHYEGLCRYAFSFLKDQSDSEEVVQKLFVKLWEKRKELNVINDPKSYLYRSVYNSSLNELKRVGRVRHSAIEDYHSVEINDASSELIGDELKTRIQSTIETLPVKCREVFQLSRFEELSYKEIAERLNISIKTVENHMGKALKLLRKGLEDYLPMVLITILLSKGW